jgi:hypothetical protein
MYWNLYAYDIFLLLFSLSIFAKTHVCFPYLACEQDVVLRWQTKFSPGTVQEKNKRGNHGLARYTRQSCYKSANKLLQICSQAVDKLCSYCLFPVGVTSLKQAVNNL